MKLCILSMQKVSNFGSLLQSYALKKLTEELGCETHFIDIHPRCSDDALVEKRLEFRGESEKSGWLHKIRRLDRYTINRLCHKKKNRRQQNLFEHFRTEALQIKEEDNRMEYDLCIIGSDEVFNCQSPTPWGFTTQLFGNVEQSSRVITYAASCGATKLAELNPDMREAIHHSFQRISGFSVRDQNTGEFTSALTKQPIEYHLDPVLIADFDQEIDQAKFPKELPRKYCVVYSYYNRIHQKKDIETIRMFCKRHQLELVALGAPQMWIRNYVVATPFEALKVIQQAAFVITDTFHGTIFSEKYNGKYAIMLRKSNANKLRDLIERLELQEHVVNSFSELDEVYQVQPNRRYSKTRQREERMRSVDYLKRFIDV